MSNDNDDTPNTSPEVSPRLGILNNRNLTVETHHKYLSDFFRPMPERDSEISKSNSLTNNLELD